MKPTETKKTNGKAGDEVRASVLKLTDELKKASVACHERADMIDKAIEELTKVAADRFELVALSVEDHITKSNDAINTVRGLVDMIQEVSKPQLALPPTFQAVDEARRAEVEKVTSTDAFKAVEAAILKSKQP
jgi:hypothetical protein